MARNIRVRGIKRKQIDEDKLALAFLLLAKVLHEQEEAEAAPKSAANDHPVNQADDAPESA
jgi:hypothetical protein